MSRITFAMTSDENLRLLQKLAVQGINDAICDACTEASVNPNDIYEATIVRNTAIHHPFLGIQLKYVALSPFTPAIRRSLNVKSKELDVKMHLSGNTYVLPLIAGFVGADAVADILSIESISHKSSHCY